MLIVNAAAAMYHGVLPRCMLFSKMRHVCVLPGARDLYASAAKDVEVTRAAVGKICEPRLKSQRVMGRERDAGWDWRRGTSKMERVAMPPAARRAVLMLTTWRNWVVDILGDGVEV